MRHDISIICFARELQLPDHWVLLGFTVMTG
jgi:hypothetical protein